MEYVDLERYFMPIKEDQELDLEVTRVWGKSIGGWLDWDDLLNQWRVVLLAEASSGKTEEFRNNKKKLFEEGKSAFYIRIEELADEGFEQALDPNATHEFGKWKGGVDDGYFFLDSLDEARLNRKRFESALKKLAHTVSHALNRSRIFISCRVSDWKGAEDEQTIKRLLPLPRNTPPQVTLDTEAALLDPIFNKQKTDLEIDIKDEDQTPDLMIVRLVPLDEVQQKKLAQAVGIEDSSEFYQAIWQKGLESLAERPGDLIELAEYWKTYKKFGTLFEMTQHAVDLKLSERDPFRPDNDVLTSKRAREGAMRIAAALTLGKTFTVRSPAMDLGPGLITGALDTRKLLSEWSDAERNSLLRRGLFAPATYGRVRFHQRATQEYLAAEWFNHLLKKGCPNSKVFNVLFSEIYGVKTVVPSLRAVAAWLSLFPHNEIRAEIIKREPLILIQHGDPGSLPVETRRTLLQAYAKKIKAGNISDDSIDHRSLWAFAHIDLAETISKTWRTCTQYYFRLALLRLVREGRICACADLISKVANDRGADNYYRIVAVQALGNCGIDKDLLLIADNLVKTANTTSAMWASELACELFPGYLNIEQLLVLIIKTKPPANVEARGFGYVLNQLWKKCPNEWRSHFIDEISKLAFSKPFVNDYQRVSNQFRFLLKHFEPIAHQLVSELDGKEPDIGLIRLLMGIERVARSYPTQKSSPPLSKLVQTQPKLHRTLFWADVEEIRENKNNSPVQHWQIVFGGIPLWHLGSKDLPWLYKDLDNRTFIDDKRIALSAIVFILQADNKFENEKEGLQQKTNQFSILVEDLANYSKPREKSDWERNDDLILEQNKRAQAQRNEKDKKSWREFRDELIADPSQVLNSDERLWIIENLTRWLKFRTKQNYEKAARQWPLLEEAFNIDVAEAYKDRMKAIWRNTKPERPRRKGARTTVKWTTIYSFAGIGIEADQNPSWANQLTEKEGEIAAKHGCLSGQGFPDWLDALIDVHCDVAAPIIRNAFRTEWKSKNDARNDLLYHYSNVVSPKNAKIESEIFEIIVRTDPSTQNHLKLGLQILDRLELSENQQNRLRKLTIKKFECYGKLKNNEFSIIYLALMLTVDPQLFLQSLQNWLDATNPEEQVDLVVRVFGKLFSREGERLISNSMKKVDVKTLKDLILIGYRYIHPARDRIHEGSGTPSIRYDAESGRDSVLSALINTSGPEAYESMMELANKPEIGKSSHLFRQRALGMAERDAERASWTEEETLTFETLHAAPIKASHDLYRVVLGVLDDIRHGFEREDASSKRLLIKLGEIKEDDETSVQNWLAEQLRLRANNRYHVYREVEVVSGNEPDIIVSGATPQIEIAIEVKQADSWSPNELKKALTCQLAEKYLKTQTRRHGVLFLTDHGRRDWKNPHTKKGGFSFNELLLFLSKTAEVTTSNASGKVQVCVYGIDATG